MNHVFGVLCTADREDRFAIFASGIGREEAVFVEGNGEVFGNRERPHIGVVHRGVAVEVAEAGERVIAFVLFERRIFGEDVVHRRLEVDVFGIDAVVGVREGGV